MCVRQVVNPSKSRQDTTPTQRITKKIKRKKGRKKREEKRNKNGWCVDSECFHSLAYILYVFYVLHVIYVLLFIGS